MRRPAPLADARVDQRRVRADRSSRRRRGSRRAASEPGSIVASAAISTSASIQVDAGVDDGDAGEHVALEDPAARLGGRRAARSARLLTPRLAFGSSATWAATRPARGAQQRQHVAEVVLARRRCRCSSSVERRGERLGVEGVGAGVDLADREVLGRRLAVGSWSRRSARRRRRRRGRRGRRRRGRRARRSSPSRRRPRARWASSSAARSSPEISGWSPERTTTVSDVADDVEGGAHRAARAVGLGLDRRSRCPRAGPGRGRGRARRSRRRGRRRPRARRARARRPSAGRKPGAAPSAATSASACPRPPP